MGKPLQNSEDVTQSLINLRDELLADLTEDGEWKITTSTREMMIFYKINSCLYSGYPDKRLQKNEN
jgi:hypothetical protein